jgi:23S rRNA (cytosine1962-C5)-methyltransferase
LNSRGPEKRRHAAATASIACRATLREGRDESLRRRHPWVFSGAVAAVHGTPAAGDTVVVESARGEFLATAAYSPQSQIRLRVWSFADEVIDSHFFRRRIEAALALRRDLGFLDADGACRLVYAEADALPGLIVDRYGDVLQCQFLSAGSERWRDVIVEVLQETLAPAAIYERSVGSGRKKEGLPSRQGPIAGRFERQVIELRSGDVRFLVDPAGGQKTGAFLDQQRNQIDVAALGARGRVLDAFSYTGGFALQALAHGAERATLIDSSAAALESARHHAELNGVAGQCEYICANAFEALRDLKDRGERYELVVLDPPKFVHGAGDLRKGTRAYKDINRLGLALVAPDGMLATFSCSGNVDAALFQKVVASASVEAGRRATIAQHLFQSPDHPLLLDFPESLYLKGLLLRVD